MQFHWLFWVFSSVIFGVGYRLGYKLVSHKFSALFNISVTTLVASLVGFTLYFLYDYSRVSHEAVTIKSIWPLVLVGAVLAGLEFSLMMMYRSGGPVSISQPLASSIVGVVMFVIGLYFFREQLNTGQVVGFFVTLVGVSLMTYYSAKK